MSFAKFRLSYTAINVGNGGWLHQRHGAWCRWHEINSTGTVPWITIPQNSYVQTLSQSPCTALTTCNLPTVRAVQGHSRWAFNYNSNSQWSHYSDVIMNTTPSQITSVSIVCSIVCSGADQRKHQSSASLAFVRGIHRWLVDPGRWIPLTKGQ